MAYNHPRLAFTSRDPTTKRLMPPLIKAVLVDDERLARHALRTLLAGHPDLAVIGEAESVGEAAGLIPRLQPEVIFLDIQMPGESGFDLLSRVSVTFHTVFVTAYDAFALRAFEVNALDYLLKPVEPERLAETLARARAAPRARLPVAPQFGAGDVIQIASGAHRHFIKISDIRAIQAEGDYSLVATRDKRRILTRKTMAEWEQSLRHLRFCRIHRSVIINASLIERITRKASEEYAVKLAGESESFPVSRRAWTDLKKLLRG
ncbi:MAG: DNA-binding response regulator [Chloracidobacterium sp. CP2_5A]|nr:MAG: DNA-binding response regulator [Chloracidobacterium sp. CP2_5A]